MKSYSEERAVYGEEDIHILCCSGCEDFYDEKAKQKKADLAESLGTDVGDKVGRNRTGDFFMRSVVHKLQYSTHYVEFFEYIFLLIGLTL